MAVLMVPGYNPDDAWPTLGLALAEWLQEWLVFGPGDVRGEPYTLDSEKVGVLARMYEVHPLPETKAARDAVLRRFHAGERYRNGTSKAGRRRFKRESISVRKGWAKTELLAAVAAGELHPDAPVRTIGWTLERGAYVPVGSGVKNPYIPLVAFTAEQSEELAFGALVVMIGEGPLADDFDLGDGDARSGTIHVLGPGGKSAGKAVALAAAPNSRDGARTTFQGFDETHRQDSDRLRHAHQTMLQNLPKRLEADAHSLEVTTSFEPGKDSIAERTHNYAKQIVKGELEEPSLFHYHRQAGDHHDLDTREGRAAAVLEASGPAAVHTDVDYVVGLSYDPDTDLQYWERVWLNREVSSDAQYFPVSRWDLLAVNAKGDLLARTIDGKAVPTLPTMTDVEAGVLWYPKPGAMVTLGFDGSRSGDSTTLVVTDIELRRQAVVHEWAHPLDKSGRPVADWEVPAEEVNAVVDEAFRRWDVVLAYFDPYWWESWVSTWKGRYGTRRIGKRRLHRVVEWHTNRIRPMALSLRAFRTAMTAGEVTHSGDPRFRSAFANARRFDTGLKDDHAKPLETIRKERSDSPNKIDCAMAADLSWEALRDAVALGAKRRSRQLQAY